jgi:hypothetical protein
MKRSLALLAFAATCRAQTVVTASFESDIPAITQPTLRFNINGQVLTDYPSLSLSTGEKVFIDQSDSTNSGLAIILSDQTSFKTTYNCPEACSQADYIARNAFRFNNDGSHIGIPGFGQTITAPLVATSTTYCIAGAKRSFLVSSGVLTF